MNLIFIFFGIFFLLIGGQFIVRASVALSFRLNLSKFVIGMTVVSFATSLPELIVSISAALNNSPSIAVQSNRFKYRKHRTNIRTYLSIRKYYS